ncbi:MAG TPA: hypothetical protein VMH90_00800, partial [Thermoplasmata archaeon]|nr:hypothetical protein [Thermoplasmata archaeon]
AAYLARDQERLARGDLSVHAGTLSDTSVSVGVAMPISPVIEAICAKRGWPIHRRSSGGTALLHRPGDLLFSVLLPAGDPRIGRGFVRAYGRYGAPLVRALATAGVEARWTTAFALSDQFCLFGPRGDVLAVGERALGGAAQHLTKAGLLHHAVVGASLDRGALAALFGVPDRLLADRLTAFGECAGTADLAEVGRTALRYWGRNPAAPDAPAA